MRTHSGIILFAGVCTTALLCSCSQRQPVSPIVEFSSKQPIGVINFGDCLASSTISNANQNFALYLTEPCLFSVGTDEEDSDTVYLYLPEDGNRVELRVDGDILYANGIPRTAYLKEEHPRNFAAWAEKADTVALKSLRIIYYEGDSADTVINDQFKKIMRVNPFVLCVTDYEDVDTSPSWMESYARQTPLLAIADSYSNSADTVESIELSNYSEARVIWLEDSDNAVLDALNTEQAPELRRLLLFSGNEIPATFEHVKALSLLDVEEVPDLRGLKELKELHITEEDTAVDLHQLPHPEILRALTADVSDGVTGMEKLVNLEFLNPLDSTFTDKELSNLLANHPRLIFLDLSLATLESLEPLSKATNLEVVALGNWSTEEVPDFAPLSKLPKLRYVALNEDLIEAGAANALRKACPQVVVFMHDGFCMGPGWLLLFLPATMITWVVKRGSSNTQRSV